MQAVSSRQFVRIEAKDIMLNIVLVEPEIPMNTGNIARTCAATRSRLHLVRPLGFDISDRAVKRAGLDYWHMVDLRVYDSIVTSFTKTRLRTFGWPPPRHRRITPRPSFGTDAGSFSARKPPACPCGSGRPIQTGASASPCGRRPAA